MRENLFEDQNEVFPVNSQVHCGQAAFNLGFANMTWDESTQLLPAYLQRVKKARFTPRIPARK